MADVRLLLVEDLGHRSDELADAVKKVNRGTGSSSKIIIDTMSSVFDVGGISAEQLAQYDAVLVDFHLATERMVADRGREVLPLTRIASACGGERTVPIETGMGVLLHLKNEVASPEYVAAREKVTAGLPNRQLTPHFMTFGAFTDGWPKFFAVAGRAWFRTTHIDASWQGSPAEVTKLRDEVLSGEQELLTGSRLNHAIAQAVPFFNAMMNESYASRASWYDQARVSPEAFDWYAMYHAARGKAGGQAGMAEQLKLRWDSHCTPTNWSTQFPPVATMLQERLREFLSQLELSGNPLDWGELTWSKSTPDHMLDVLTNSFMFWQSADVRAALVEHRCANNAPLPPDMVTPPTGVRT